MKNSPEKVWNNCLGFISDNISEQSFKTWFLPIQPIKLKGSRLNIQVPSKFFYEWIEEHYIKLLKTYNKHTSKQLKKIQNNLKSYL